MEINRLKEFQGDINPELFNELFNKVQPLKKRLVYDIDEKRIGVSKDIIDSWFDDKFMFVYQKYFKKYDKEVLLGHLLNSLKRFKYRILRRAYQDHIENNILNLDYTLTHIVPDETEVGDKELLIQIVSEFFKARLSQESYLIFQVELQPPLYIIDKLKSSNSKIPARLIAEFLGWDTDNKVLNIINQHRKYIKDLIPEAQKYFETKLV